MEMNVIWLAAVMMGKKVLMQRKLLHQGHKALFWSIVDVDSVNAAAL